MATTINGVLIQDRGDSTLTGSVTTPVATNAVTLQSLDVYQTGSGEGSGEVFAYEASSHRLFVMNNVTDKIEVVIISATGDLSKDGEITVGSLPNYGGMNSVAVAGGILAVAVENSTKSSNGIVALYDTSTGALIKTVEVGALPDMLTFTPDGKKIVVANEGERDGSTDAPGSISLIDLSAGAANATVATTGFSSLAGQESALIAAGVRLAPSVSATTDIEPEYIDLSLDGKTAYVTLQEANSVGIFDISGTTPVLKSIVPLGFIDHNLPGNAADFSDRDGTSNAPSISINTSPIRGLPMPDAIATWSFDGVTYFATANEGDARSDGSDEARLSTLDLNNTVFGTQEAVLKGNGEAGRLNVSTIDGDTDPNVAGLEQVYVFGGRGISIFRVDEDGNAVKVGETGGEFEAIAAALPNASTVFNGENLGGFDTRSDNKGVEPEAIDVANIGGRYYAFVGLERLGGVMVYDVTDPANPTYTTYMPPTNVEFGPEIAKVIAANESPTGEALLLTANEISGSISAYEVTSATYTLQILHMSDGEAGLLAGDTAPIMGALIGRFDDDYASTLILAGGDTYIPGPFLNAGTDPSLNAVIGLTAPGRPDTAIHNAFGVEVSAIGNHEWDLGSNIFADTLKPQTSGGNTWVGAQYALVSANLDFSGDSAMASLAVTGGQEASTIKGKIAPWVTVTEGGEKIGILGATTQVLERISSPTGTEVEGFPKTGQPGDGTEVDDMTLLAAQLQPTIDQMIAAGIDKIILQSHLQSLDNERLLATKLTGVDIILAAGSNTRLGDGDDVAASFPGHAPTFADTYPIVTAGLDGAPTLIINTDNEYTYLGRLVVEFDQDGEIILGSLDPAINGAYAATQTVLADVYGDDIDEAFAEGSIGAEVKEITEAVDAVIAAKDGTIFGFTDVYLEGERNFVRNQETNLGNLTADANLAAARDALGDGPLLVSLKNGGGIRAQIGSIDVVTGDKEVPIANPDANKPEGAVSDLDIENSLRFDNKLVVFDTTPAGLLAILEHGMTQLNRGGFPQIGGVKFSYDPDLPAGQRVTDVALVDEDGRILAILVDDGDVVRGAPATISVVTLSFLATGGDGYPIPSVGDNFRYLLNDGTVTGEIDPAQTPANALGEQQALSEFMLANHGTAATAFDEADTPQSADERIQNLNFRDDTVFDSIDVVGGRKADKLFGTQGNEAMFGFGGNDRMFGNNGDDAMFGGRGNDRLSGQTGNDLLNGEQGNDRLFGGSGGDSFEFTGDTVGRSRDIVEDLDFTEGDRLVFEGFEAGTFGQGGNGGSAVVTSYAELLELDADSDAVSIRTLRGGHLEIRIETDAGLARIALLDPELGPTNVTSTGFLL